MIPKHATNLLNCKSIIRYYTKARDGMFDFLRAMREQVQLECVLLPSYIGYSPKEGSGVYDPIEKVQGLNFMFYRVDSNLQIDLESVQKAVHTQAGKPFVLLRIDYYGFTDPSSKKILELVHAAGGYILEDNAHSIPCFNTLCGEYSDASFYAMHKFLPLAQGGMLILSNKELSALRLCGEFAPLKESNLWEYDFFEISMKRRRNFAVLEELFRSCSKYFVCMRTLAGDSQTIPYSFPTILKSDLRFSLYNYLNERGFGVTCLYYNIIEQIPTDIYPESKFVSDHILNFPVHQDVDVSEYAEMIQAATAFFEKGHAYDQ